MLPTTPEEITASWIGDVLGQDVETIQITGAELNATASKVFVSVTYQDKDATSFRPTHLCLKGGFNPAMLAIESYSQILRTLFAREVQFFNDIAPKLTNVSLPKVWWAGTDITNGQAITIMDDLSKDCIFGDPQFSWSIKSVKAGVEQLAGLHASTWNSSDTAELSWLTPAYEQIVLGLTRNWDATVLGKDRPPVPYQLRDQKRIVGALEKHFANKNPRFKAIIHGDAHIGNVYFDSRGDPRFLDWQTTHFGSIFHDVSYFIAGALSVEDRRANEMDILEHYLRTLARNGGPDLSIHDDEVTQDYRRSCISGVAWMLAPYEMQSKERIFAMCERLLTAIVDHEAVEIIESLP